MGHVWTQAEGEELLHRFVQRARSADTVGTLIRAVMECVRGVAGASVGSVVIQAPTGVEIHQVGAPEAFVRRYLAYTAVAADPIHAALATRHGVVRSNELFGDAEWRCHPFFRDVAAPFGLEAYMAGELVDAHGPRGAIGVVRTCGHPMFSVRDAQRLHTICLHASVALTRFAQRERTVAPADLLSPRQQLLVQLVANGLTNDQIGQACGITRHAVKKALERLFLRMSVSSRAELVARLGVRAGA